MKLRVLVIHQSAELYGSDRSLLELLNGLDRDRFESIVCVPEDGPLIHELESAGIEVHILPLVKVSRSIFTVNGLINLPKSLILAISALDSIVAGRKINLVYTNTIAVLAGAFWAWRRIIPHVWHIREIIRRPKIVGLALRKICLLASKLVICNSGETFAWVQQMARQSDKAIVIWNGVDSPAGANRVDTTKADLKRELAIDPDLPLLLLVGRINAWKGQDLLLDAVELLHQRNIDKFQVMFVGSAPPGQEYFVDGLNKRMADSSRASHLHFRKFTQNVAMYYSAADILVVPSREPEPFGRVAVEGMATRLPVIAADHGGLKEIVVSGTTGLLVTPNDVGALSDAISILLAQPSLRESMGEAGKIRQQQLFSLQAYRSAVGDALYSTAVTK